MVVSKRDHTPSTSSTSLHKKPREASPRERGFSRSSNSSLPKYLRQYEDEISHKFERLNKLQKDREAHAEENPDDSPWVTFENLDRNRYINILPWDMNRVQLKVPPGENDYINASPIVLERTKDGSVKRYIATQGPKKGQSSHLWRMVMEQTGNVAVIAMLTKHVEQNRDKCTEYYPTAQHPEMVFDNFSDFGEVYKIRVKLLETTFNELAKADVRKMELRVEQLVPVKNQPPGLTLIQKETVVKTKIVWHLFFEGWPDWGVPEKEDKEALWEMIKLANEKNEYSITNPMIVHCSAGVGRSGTFITLDHFLTELKDGNLDVRSDSYDPIFDIVNRLREQRMYMVQAEPQYQFIYKVLREKYLLAAQQRRSRRSATLSPPGGTSSSRSG